MSHTVSVTIDDRTFARLMDDADRAHADLRGHMAVILRDVAASRIDQDAVRAVAAGRAADPRRRAPTGSPPRLTRTHWDAVDAALERAGIIPDRTGRGT